MKAWVREVVVVAANETIACNEASFENERRFMVARDDRGLTSPATYRYLTARTGRWFEYLGCNTSQGIMFVKEVQS
jgi:hypothetical protein